jgi:hypothetical protein
LRIAECVELSMDSAIRNPQSEIRCVYSSAFPNFKILTKYFSY